MKLTWKRQTIRPRTPLRDLAMGRREKETIIIQLEHDGVTGFGEAVPSELYGQTLDSCEKTLAAVASCSAMIRSRSSRSSSG